MIVIRLYVFRRRIQKSMGSTYGSQYASIITMVVESEGLTLAVEIWLFISFWSDTVGEVVQIPYLLLAQAQVVAPLLLIFRVAQGKRGPIEC
ncbi:hypothetical protein BDQ17DRAFT_517753 [Cyathus striatus]|nr:hypothetical protein BDQ17DRAFT_517753 [Cyathus striatus]